MQKQIYTWKWGNNPTHDEYTTTRGFVIGNYNESVAGINKLAVEAQNDFPSLELKDIEVGKISGTGYMDGFWCVSFLLDANETHKDYWLYQRSCFSW